MIASAFHAFLTAVTVVFSKVDALRLKYGLTADAVLEKARPYLAAMESRRMALR